MCTAEFEEPSLLADRQEKVVERKLAATVVFMFRSGLKLKSPHTSKGSDSVSYNMGFVFDIQAAVGK